MKVAVKGHTTIIKNTADTVEVFCEKVTHDLTRFSTQNLILDISHSPVSLAEIKLFTPLSKSHHHVKKSFVLVVKDFDYNAVPSQLQVVPSLQEAHDIIELEEIERDLGF